MKFLIFCIFIYSSINLFTDDYVIKINKKNKLKPFLEKTLLKDKSTFKFQNLESNQKFNEFFDYYLASDNDLKSINSLDILSLEKIKKYKIEQLEIKDEKVSEQWYFNNVNASKAWQFSQGEGIIVAVIDTGINFEHPDLIDNLWINSDEDLNKNGTFEPWFGENDKGQLGDYNRIDDDNNGFVDDVTGYDFVDQNLVNFGDYSSTDPDISDEQGHGTSVSSVISASKNDKGMVGLAPKSKIMTLRAFDIEGEGESDDIARSIIYASLNGAKVINMSFGESFNSAIVREAIEFAYLNGSLLVSSSGNENNFNPHFPSDLPQVISVSGTNETDNKYGFGNFGSFLDLTAPAQNILVADFNGDYKFTNGTSFAAPIVASAAALLISKYPELNIEQIRQTLINAVLDLGDRGWDPIFGNGRIDFEKLFQTNLNSKVKFDSPIFDYFYNKSTLKEIPISGSFVLPLMENADVYLGQGYFPENLSDENLQYLSDSLGYDVNQFSLNNSDIESFKWQKIGYFDSFIYDDTIMNLNIQNLKDTIYTLRIKFNLKNNSTFEKRVAFNVYQNLKKLKYDKIDLIEVFDNGFKTPLVYTATNFPSILQVQSIQNNDTNYYYDIEKGTKFNWALLKNNSKSGQINIETESYNYNSDTASNISNYSINPYQINKDYLEKQELDFIRSYIFPELTDFNKNGKRELIINDLTTLSIGKPEIYEYDNGKFNKIFELNDIWLPTAFGDSNGDGIEELLTISGKSFRLYQSNTRMGNPFEKVLFQKPNEALFGELMYDFDKDGLDEIVLNDEKNYYIYTFKNGEYKILAETTTIQGLENIGVSRNGIAGDFNNDGINELCIANNLGMTFFYEFKNGSLGLSQMLTNQNSLSRQILSKGDIDGDGDLEIIQLNYGSFDLFNSNQSEKEIWLLRVFDFQDNIYKEITREYFFGVREGLAGNTGLGYRNGINISDIDGKIGDEIIISTFPNLYIFKFIDNSLKPVWHYPNANSNSTLVYDFDQNSKNEIYLNGFNNLLKYEISDSVLLAPTNFSGYFQKDSIYLIWNNSLNSDITKIYELNIDNNQLTEIAETNQEKIQLFKQEEDVSKYFVVQSCKKLTNECSDYSLDFISIYCKNTNFESLEVLNNKTIKIKFDGKLANNAPSALNFKIKNQDLDLHPYLVNLASDNEVLLNFRDSLISGSYFIKVNEFFDYFNNPIESFSSSFTIQNNEKPKELAIKSFEIQGSNLIGIEFTNDVESGYDDVNNFEFKPFGNVVIANIDPILKNKIQIAFNLPNRAIGYNHTLTVKNLISVEGYQMTTGPGSSIEFTFASNNLSELFIYPHPVDVSTNQTHIFANLPLDAEVLIFDYQGKLLNKLLEKDGNGGVEWDGLDDSGKKLEPGVYYFQVIDNSQDNRKSDLIKFFVK